MAHSELRKYAINAQDFTKAAWAFATTGQSDVQLYTMSAWLGMQHIYAINAQELATTAWAFTTAGPIGCPTECGVGVDGRAVHVRLRWLELANAAWAFVMAGRWDAKLLTALTKMADSEQRMYA